MENTTTALNQLATAVEGAAAAMVPLVERIRSLEAENKRLKAIEQRFDSLVEAVERHGGYDYMECPGCLCWFHESEADGQGGEYCQTCIERRSAGGRERDEVSDE